ncbi:hypothetical protein BOTBODRAFT_188149 [Botryobasidium botryosum FD-172 SS1]|uniref:Uncharacterized protein n=1 Tax=Botryobasidium botryosum (strain FD-172 SS1) TaxID=930990 RepID=A0A067MGY0_BOTB1|nr:hypothetical protein BOTBODRAFT_188149 [Botryobasidium botryosum FD-172 SS1]
MQRNASFYGGLRASLRPKLLRTSSLTVELDESIDTPLACTYDHQRATLRTPSPTADDEREMWPSIPFDCPPTTRTRSFGFAILKSALHHVQTRVTALFTPCPLPSTSTSTSANSETLDCPTCTSPADEMLCERPSHSRTTSTSTSTSGTSSSSTEYSNNDSDPSKSIDTELSSAPSEFFPYAAPKTFSHEAEDVTVETQYIRSSKPPRRPFCCNRLGISKSFDLDLDSSFPIERPKITIFVHSRVVEVWHHTEQS